MKKFTLVNMLLAFVLILGSCATNSNVVSNKLISKRKYTKGFHINKKNHYKDSNEDVAYEKTVEVDKNSSDDKIKVNRKAEKQIKNSITSISITYEEVTIEETSTEYNEPSEYRGMTSDGIFDQDVQEVTEVVETTQRNVEETKSVASKASRPDTTDPVMIILLVILCLLIPPVAVAIVDGISKMFWIDLVLFLIAISGFFLFPGLAGLAGLASVILALLVVFDVI